MPWKNRNAPQLFAIFILGIAFAFQNTKYHLDASSRLRIYLVTRVQIIEFKFHRQRLNKHICEFIYKLGISEAIKYNTLRQHTPIGLIL